MCNSYQDQLQVPGESTVSWGNGVVKYLSVHAYSAEGPLCVLM